MLLEESSFLSWESRMKSHARVVVIGGGVVGVSSLYHLAKRAGMVWFLWGAKS